MDVPKPTRCIITQDNLGTHYTVPSDDTQPLVDIWWNRLPRIKKPTGGSVVSELLFIRQENDFKGHADLSTRRKSFSVRGPTTTPTGAGGTSTSSCVTWVSKSSRARNPLSSKSYERQ